MLKSSAMRGLTLYLLLVLVLVLLIYVPSPIGLADNSDFNRTLRAFGLTPDGDGTKYWSVGYHYRIANPSGIVRYFQELFLPVKDNPAEYYSTQFVFVKIALFLNAIANELARRDPGRFHLAFQTVPYLLVYAFALFLFMKEKWKKTAAADLAVKACMALLFLDCGYLVYFNSFYGESTTFIFLILSFVLLLYLEKKKNGSFVYAGAILSLFLFSGSKPANFPSALLMAIPILYYAITKEKPRKKIVIGVMVVGMLAASYGYVKSAPDWMKKVTTFQAVFFGVLYDNPAPAQAARDLGLPPELSKLESLNAYVQHPVNPYSRYNPAFQASFFDRTSKLDVFVYYATHPVFFAKKLDESAEASLPLRPAYLSNLTLPGDEADLRFDFRWNVWESVRKSFSGFASVFVGLVMVLSAVNLISLRRKKADAYAILLRMAFLGAAAGQFAVPVLSNGNADLQKHMFLFNVHLDLLILLLALDNLDFTNRLLKRAGAAALVVLVATSFTSGKPDAIAIGRIHGKPIHWYILEQRGDWIKVIAKDALYRGSYDDNSNDYAQASILFDLAAMTDVWFTPEERRRIRQANYPALRNFSNANEADSGDRPHYWFSPMKYVAQNSGRAYRKTYSAYIALPSVEDAERLFRLSRTAAVLPDDYWLSTPYFGSTDKARIVSSDYQVYHRKVDTVLGIRPVMWVRKPDKPYRIADSIGSFHG